MNFSLLNRILEEETAFAILYRPSVNTDLLDVICGRVIYPETLDAITLENKITPSYSTLILVPYNQLKERSFAHIDDNSRLIAMEICQHETVSIQYALDHIQNSSIKLLNGAFDICNEEYADIVQKIIKEEIGRGEGSNFVIKRQYIADINEYSVRKALSIFLRLIQKEIGTYWTFIIHTGDRTFVGASPEMHISLNNNIATMNPISGTYRYPSSGPTLEGIMNFLSKPKEMDELYMVVEEELKMISQFCPQGGKIVGPFLKEMSRLAHTEYFIQGKTNCDPRIILRETMFAPTVVGSPIENACRVIKKYEHQGRGYYTGIAALLGYDLQGNPLIDSTILIRSADINQNGRVKIGVGSTIVRHSNAHAEAIETQVKAQALLDAMNSECLSYV